MIQMVDSFTSYTNLCSWLIRLDHLPFRSCLSGSGLPVPVNGDEDVSTIRDTIFESVLGSDVLHSSKCFKASGLKVTVFIIYHTSFEIPQW